MPEVTLSQAVQISCQNLQRTVTASRDALLFAAAAPVEADTLKHLCRRIAEQLGGQAAELSQLLMAHGCHPIAPDDAQMDRLRGTLVGDLVPPASAPRRKSAGLERPVARHRTARASARG